MALARSAGVPAVVDDGGTMRVGSMPLYFTTINGYTDGAIIGGSWGSQKVIASPIQMFPAQALNGNKIQIKIVGEIASGITDTNFAVVNKLE